MNKLIYIKKPVEEDLEEPLPEGQDPFMLTVDHFKAKAIPESEEQKAVIEKEDVNIN